MPAPCENSIDAVASRDIVAEFLFVCSHGLGSTCRAWRKKSVIWSFASQFAWVELDDAYSTGSSIMPQKKNPDIAELTRGMSGHADREPSGLLATLKGMPLAYNRDLAEDKRDAVETSTCSNSICRPSRGWSPPSKFDMAPYGR